MNLGLGRGWVARDRLLDCVRQSIIGLELQVQLEHARYVLNEPLDSLILRPIRGIAADPDVLVTDIDPQRALQRLEGRIPGAALLDGVTNFPPGRVSLEPLATDPVP